MAPLTPTRAFRRTEKGRFLSSAIERRKLCFFLLLLPNLPLSSASLSPLVLATQVADDAAVGVRRDAS